VELVVVEQEEVNQHPLLLEQPILEVEAEAVEMVHVELEDHKMQVQQVDQESLSYQHQELKLLPESGH
jgi:hypothetical protein